MREATDKSQGVVNIVELIADPEDCAFDEPCAFGHRVGFHAVYCHNTEWADAPRKCHRCSKPDHAHWEAGGEHKDCPGFSPNSPEKIRETTY